MTEVVKQIALLIIKQTRGELSYEEEIELEQWAAQSAANRALLEQLAHDETIQKDLIDYYEAEADRYAILKKIEDATQDQDAVPVIAMQPRPRRTYLYYFIAAAATIAAVLTGVLYFGRTNRIPEQAPVTQTATNDVLPGGNKAVLTLSDGRKIVLNDAANGVITKEGSTSVSKTIDGKIEYNAAPLTTHSSLTFNTLSTPHGGQFQLVLPDRTRVWLNAASSITYPTAFTGNERRVQISGEAYFEVAKAASGGKNIPFIVSILTAQGAKTGDVEVLGTHFNINAYDDENDIKTTLLEGKVKVVNAELSNKGSVILKPGQQSQMSSKGQLVVKNDADLEEAVAWKNGEFLFRSADIETLMRQVSRWYNIEISYPNGKPKDKFSGKIGRNVNLSQLLQILAYSELKCKLEGKKLVVLN